ncbi:FecR family protein [Herbaspirillum sp. alder98]|uniref:FecR family protein n=1 Tax=Herbaspirillum sp. alder98 TaxID=2913096 RepID=UPI001CD83A35|nr:FecR domain-containing protein [Herbaspirillum sp. alder98]MCA1325589.1 FecR domain-containing protein [Herbaspirillum sp. alder98]
MSSDNQQVPPDVLKQEARVWLRRLTSGEATEWDAQAFTRWKQSSAAHARAFDEAKRQWQALGPAIGLLLQKDQAVAARHETSMRRPQPGRRLFLRVAGGAMAAVAGAAIVHPPLQLWPSFDEWQADARTAKGEQRQLAMGGGVSVTLNTQTSIRRDMTDAGGGALELIGGEAAVDLATGATPFSVAAGSGRSTAREGQFEVRHLDGRVCVTCLRGTVQVAHPKGQARLAERQQLVYDSDAFGGVVAIDGEAASAWRRGELVFRQTPLVRVIDEINRYRPGRVVLAASAQENSAVNGRFSIAALDSALVQLQYSFGLQARRLPGGVVVLS